MITRQRQTSLLQMTLHFSCTVGSPQTGQIMAEGLAAAESPLPAASSESDLGILAVTISGATTVVFVAKSV
ncbi:MAG TPA: hypothetical protein VF626_08700 [Chthoniobacterales bacterium]